MSGLYLALQLFRISFSTVVLLLFQFLFILPLYFGVLARYYPPDRSPEGTDEVSLLFLSPSAAKHGDGTNGSRSKPLLTLMLPQQAKANGEDSTFSCWFSVNQLPKSPCLFRLRGEMHLAPNKFSWSAAP